MKLKMFLIIIILILLTGCQATYNLDIGPNGYEEKLIINSTSQIDNDRILEYPIPVRYGDQGNSEDPLVKSIYTEYYDSKLTNDNNLKKLQYNYLFDENSFNNSNIINNAYDTIIKEEYDYDEDGVNDYMLISTTKDFKLFEKYGTLDGVTINIVCHYEVISSNADKVNKNIYTWYLDKDNIKAINLVYNPDNYIDHRTLWEKILEGEYTNIFTISILLSILALLIYLFLKKKSQSRDKI